MSEDQKECFVIMPISDAEGYDKGHFLEYIMILLNQQ